MNRLGVAVAAIALTGSLAPPASAAMCIRLSVEPVSPVANTQTRVVLRTYAPYSDGLRPWRVRSYPFRVEAVAPTGRVFRVVVRPERANRWVGSFWFPTRGYWIIRVTNFGPSYPKGCAEVLRVRVAKRR
jgi:hypothetical protein